MRICFVLNSIESEKAGSSVAIMARAHKLGHEVFAIGVGGFHLSYNGDLKVDTCQVPHELSPPTPEKFLALLKGSEALQDRIDVDSLDVLFIRNNPYEEGPGREWAGHSGIAFGQMVQQRGVLVLNDAHALSRAFIDKLYFEELPKSIKPASIISRNKEDILEFWEQQGRQMVLKPLEGSGGQQVYLIDKKQHNLNQIINTLADDGYIIAQEFLPDVRKGDVRVLLMNGRILKQDGIQAVIRRVSEAGEFRSNFSLGATAKSHDLTSAMENIVNVTAPRLIADGLFLVGLDIVVDKLIEINVLSPGGLNRFSDIGRPDFTLPIVRAIERKLEYKKMHGNRISNRVLATMD